ncbi:Nitrate/nitrite sensor protein (EC [uncultured Gammaproteobacteria bacterium]|nr:Nitrate/nitrite sensor protein (EC [uncultured Gammaproteobacteria bacterium]
MKRLSDWSFRRSVLFLSQEIHDSLAQTIYSLKLQVTVLDDMLKQGNKKDAGKKVASLQLNITQANQELRELMCNFRVPLDPRGIEASLENLVNSFRAEENIATYLQVEGKFDLASETEMQIMRITKRPCLIFANMPRRVMCEFYFPLNHNASC